MISLPAQDDQEPQSDDAFPLAGRPIAAPALAPVMLMALASCAALTPPTQESISGRTPSGTVSLDETFVAAFAEGSGTLTFKGQSYPFKLIGSVMGPGAGLDKLQASGEVYNLTQVTDFPGRYTQGTGPAGYDNKATGQLWLGNSAGVVMHLQSQSQGAILSIGRDEILIRMSQ